MLCNSLNSLTGTVTIVAWEQKGFSDSLNGNKNLFSRNKWYGTTKFSSKINEGCLKHNIATFNVTNVMNLFIVYEQMHGHII